MPKLTPTQLHAQAIEAQKQLSTRMGLGGYNADAPTILFLTATVLNLTNEVIELRKEVQKIKKGIPKK